MEESKAAVAKAQLAAEQEQNLPCPRCDSNNTKFCYYNNYSRSQPRYFCKDCRRYWTKGGTLRNIPVGAGTRKNSKRSYAAAAAVKAKRRPCSPSSAPPSALSAIPLQPDPLGVIYAPPDADHRLLDVISLAPSNGPFGSLLESFHWEASGAATSLNFGGLNPWIPAPGPELQSHSDSSAGGDENPAPPPEEDFLGLLGDPSCLAGEWPDPAINTPGSSFQ